MGFAGAAVGGCDGWRLVAKPCDCCSSGQALIFCRTDSAYLCMSCDSKIHDDDDDDDDTIKLSPKHERVWMCEVCEQVPASVTCKADAVTLCVTCDRDIHTANPLAQRHDRVPVVPFYETCMNSSGQSNSDLLSSTCDTRDDGDELISSNKTIGLDGCKPIEFLFSETVNFLDVDYPISLVDQYRVNDGVVPVHEIDFTNSHINSYTQSSLRQNVSNSLVDIGVVPDGNSMSEICCHSVEMGVGDTPLPLIGMEREARVLRYRQKRKNRKFNKTIRYASRKAYAETRPRIKGRFAKRTLS